MCAADDAEQHGERGDEQHPGQPGGEAREIGREGHPDQRGHPQDRRQDDTGAPFGQQPPADRRVGAQQPLHAVLDLLAAQPGPDQHGPDPDGGQDEPGDEAGGDGESGHGQRGGHRPPPRGNASDQDAHLPGEEPAEGAAAALGGRLRQGQGRGGGRTVHGDGRLPGVARPGQGGGLVLGPGLRGGAAPVARGVEAAEPEGREQGQRHRDHHDQQAAREEPAGEFEPVPAEGRQGFRDLGEPEAEGAVAALAQLLGQGRVHRVDGPADAQPAEGGVGGLPADPHHQGDEEPDHVADAAAQHGDGLEEHGRGGGERQQRQGQHQEGLEQGDQVDAAVLAAHQLHGERGDRQHAEHRGQHQEAAEELGGEEQGGADGGGGQDLADPGLLVPGDALADDVEAAQGEPERPGQGGGHADVRAVVRAPVLAEREDHPLAVGRGDRQVAEADGGQQDHQVDGAAHPVLEVPGGQAGQGSQVHRRTAGRSSLRRSAAPRMTPR